LVWRIESFVAIEEMERRFNEAFIAELVWSDRRQFDRIVALLRNSTVSNGKGLSRLLRRIVSSSHFNDSQTALMLLRLCEIDPDRWTDHMALTRDLLHAQWTRTKLRNGLDAMRSAQDRLALQLYRAIGYDRLKKGLAKLHMMTGAPNTVANDNWFWRALVERSRAIVPGIDGTIAPADRPNDRWKLTGKCVVFEPPSRLGDSPPTVNEALGQNVVPSDEEYAEA